MGLADGFGLAGLGAGPVVTTATRDRRFSAVSRSRLLLVLVVMMVIQLTLSPEVRLLGVHPDLMILLPVAGGLVGGEERGAIIGFFAGLLTDLFLQTPIGLSCLTYVLVGYAVGLLQGAVLQASRWLALAIAVVASGLGELLYAITSAIVGQSQMLNDRLGPVVGIVSALNGVVALVVVPILRWAIFPRPAGSRRSSRW